MGSRTAPAWSMRFGMYQGARIYPTVRDAYATAVRAKIVEPALARDADDLGTFVQRYERGGVPSEKDYQRALEALKAYLLLTKPRAKDEPAMTEADRTWLGARIVRKPKRKEDERPAQAQAAAVDVYLRLYAGGMDLGLTRADDSVRGARTVLKRVNPERLVLDQLITELDREDLNLGIQELVGFGVTRLEATGKVRGAFTRKGWEKVVSERLANAGAGGDAWVLGPADEKAAAEHEKLEAEYFKLYFEEWKKFFDTVKVRSATDAQDALALLQELGDSKPLAVLLAEIGRNSRVEGAAGAVKEQAAGFLAKAGKQLRAKVGIEEKDFPTPGVRTGPGVYDPETLARALKELAAFGAAPAEREAGGKDEAPAAKKPAPLDVYQEQLDFLRDELKTYLDEGGKEPALVETRLKNTRKLIDALVRKMKSEWRARMTALLMSPLDDVAGIVSGMGGGNANARWCAEVEEPFVGAFAKKYPFAPLAVDDVPMASFVEVFAPAGKLWQGFEKDFGPKVSRQDTRFDFKEKDPSLRPSLLGFFSRAAAITGAMFPPGSATPMAKLAVQILGHAWHLGDHLRD